MKEKITNLILNLWAKVPQKIKDILVKIYSNKKVFWPITIAFSLVFLILIAGLLFGNKSKVTNSVKNTPSPTPQNQNEVPEKNDNPLSQIETKLNNLKTQINAFDVKQSRLQPPPLNFDIRF